MINSSKRTNLFNSMVSDYRNDEVTSMIFNLSYSDFDREVFFKILSSINKNEVL